MEVAEVLGFRDSVEFRDIRETIRDQAVFLVLAVTRVCQATQDCPESQDSQELVLRSPLKTKAQRLQATYSHLTL